MLPRAQFSDLQSELKALWIPCQGSPSWALGPAYKWQQPAAYRPPSCGCKALTVPRQLCLETHASRRQHCEHPLGQGRPALIPSPSDFYGIHHWELLGVQAMRGRPHDGEQGGRVPDPSFSSFWLHPSLNPTECSRVQRSCSDRLTWAPRYTLGAHMSKSEL